ncbi:serine/threonine-protein kinase [Nocardioides caldifontis]|uniref:serine/threonine-protein kinase n=1 Tax=Nocardioides caldifontis TaxID=2588938 RepID=UPI0011E05787|nr:serine/threonine-protein kinase [Nocardioides caldifontis]
MLTAVGEVIAGRYELVDLLGAGGAGAVWRVWDHREGCYRAAKILRQSDSDSLLRFVQETSRRISHPHVVAPYGWSGEDDRVLFTMPLVDGGSLAQLLADHGALPAGWAGELAAQALGALARVHEAGLAHRDVKPGNLLLDATGTGAPHVRLSDFGAAAQVGGPRLTSVGTVIGTPGYLAPEQAEGAEPDPAQDVYALGVVLRQMLTGTPPDAAGAPPSRPPGLDATAAALWAVAERMTAREPGDRPTAEEALWLLDAVPGGRELSAGADPDNPVEVFRQLPPLPPGWGPDGPGRAGGADEPRPPTPPAHESPPATRLIRQTGPETAPEPRRTIPAAAWVLALVGVVLLVLAVLVAL